MYFCTRNISRESWDKMSIIKKKKAIFNNLWKLQTNSWFSSYTQNKTWPVSSKCFDLPICPFPMCCLLHLPPLFSSRHYSLGMPTLLMADASFPPHLGTHSPSICLDCAVSLAQRLRLGVGAGKREKTFLSKERLLSHLVSRSVEVLQSIT